MSSDDLADFWVHQVTVETYQGTNGRSVKLYAAPVIVRGLLTRKMRFVRNAAGEQVTSESAFSTDAAHDALFVPESRVTLDDDTRTTVISRATSTSGDLDLPDRTKAYLQ